MILLRNTVYKVLIRSLMESSEGYFQSACHATNYKKFRCDIPEEFIRRILDFLGKEFQLNQCIAVDVGCGSGQSTFPLAPHLLKVIGVDISIAQITAIEGSQCAKNVEFRVGGAECLPIDDKSVHLVVAMHAVHWFDYSAFIKEVDRVLIPGGVVAIGDGESGYQVLGYEEEANKLLEDIKRKASPHWHYNGLQKDKFYQTVQPPYEEYTREQMPIKFNVSVDFFIGRLKTLSGFGKFLDNHPEECEEMFKDFQNKFLKILCATGSAEETRFSYIKPYILILSRKPK